MTPASILIIGEDPTGMDFAAPGTPPGVNEAFIRDGLNGSRDRLVAAGHEAEVLWTTSSGPDGAETAGGQLRAALAARRRDVIVIGAGLRTLPHLAGAFERLINVILEQAAAAGTPAPRIGFNSRPGDSDAAALRVLEN